MTLPTPYSELDHAEKRFREAERSRWASVLFLIAGAACGSIWALLARFMNIHTDAHVALGGVTFVLLYCALLLWVNAVASKKAYVRWGGGIVWAAPDDARIPALRRI